MFGKRCTFITTQCYSNSVCKLECTFTKALKHYMTLRLLFLTEESQKLLHISLWYCRGCKRRQDNQSYAHRCIHGLYLSSSLVKAAVQSCHVQDNSWIMQTAVLFVNEKFMLHLTFIVAVTFMFIVTIIVVFVITFLYYSPVQVEQAWKACIFSQDLSCKGRLRCSM
jgi:hypothetical protein